MRYYKICGRPVNIGCMLKPGAGIVFDERLHEAGERLGVASQAKLQALAWWVGAELVRRHFGQVFIDEGFIHQYGKALIPMYRHTPTSRQWHQVAYLVMGPQTHLTPAGWPNAGGQERFNWLEVLLAENPRKYVVEQLERAQSLPVPETTPATTEWSIGPRLISAFLQRTLMGPDRWLVTNGTYSDDDFSGVYDEFFALFPEADAGRRENPAGKNFVSGPVRYWFLQPIKGGQTGEPVAAVDALSGIAWGPRGRIPLLKHYRSHGSRIDKLVSDALPAAF